MLFLGPKGAVLAGLGYANAEQESLRQKYPDMPLVRVRELSLLSAVVQASLDVVGVKGLKAAPSLVKLLTRPSVEVGKRALKGGALTFAVENVVELGQDFSTPLLQEMMHGLRTDMPVVDWDWELRHFWRGRADVALGMIPLTLLGMGAATVNEVAGAGTNTRNRPKVYDGFQQENVASSRRSWRLEFTHHENGVYFLG